MRFNSKCYRISISSIVPYVFDRPRQKYKAIILLLSIGLIVITILTYKHREFDSFFADSSKEIVNNFSTYSFVFTTSITKTISKASIENRLMQTMIAPSKPKDRPDDVSQYVSFAGEFEDGRGLGNQIFCFAAVVYVAELTGRQIAVKNFDHYITIDEVFQLNVERYNDLCPCYTIHEQQHLAYREDIDKEVVNNPNALNKSILVGGYRQSWKYTMAIDRRLRKHLVFKPEIQTFAEKYLKDNIPHGWNKAGFIRVGIHVRRGDITNDKHFIRYGYTVPNDNYFRKAMNYFTNRYIQSRIQFIAVSNDLNWTREHVTLRNSSAISSDFVNVIFPTGHSSGQDLAILSFCDHVIMSTGTFGWWAAWLAKGTTIYYTHWPRKGSPLSKQFKHKDYFPPLWIAMTN